MKFELNRQNGYGLMAAGAAALALGQVGATRRIGRKTLAIRSGLTRASGPAMDIVEFRIEAHENYGQVVGILINSVSLAELAEDFEFPRYKLKSAYVGIPSADLADAPSHFLGDSDPLHTYDGRVQLLGCSCGWSPCWPLACRIDAGPAVVTWSDFLQPFRDKDSDQGYWRYDGFGPFMFDRRQYEQALQAHAFDPRQVDWQTRSGQKEPRE